VQDSRDVIDELIDRYGEPPKSVMGLINVALTRNRALRLKITEIVQRGEKVFFYIAQPEIAQIKALSNVYKNRIRFVDSDKAYFAVALDKKQLSHELMAQVIDTMESSIQTKKED
jgi:transcription-repair coupling factor (superfamily II helicase)